MNNRICQSNEQCKCEFKTVISSKTEIMQSGTALNLLKMKGYEPLASNQSPGKFD
jgi:hypothetical protein